MIKEVCSQISSIDTHVEMQPLSWHPTDKREARAPQHWKKHAKGPKKHKGEEGKGGHPPREDQPVLQHKQRGCVGPLSQPLQKWSRQIQWGRGGPQPGDPLPVGGKVDGWNVAPPHPFGPISFMQTHRFQHGA